MILNVDAIHIIVNLGVLSCMDAGEGVGKRGKRAYGMVKMLN